MVQSYAYGYTVMGQLQSVSLPSGIVWGPTYDTMGRVTSVQRWLPDTWPVAGLDFAYAYDDAGNRLSASRGTPNSELTPNSLNQTAASTVPGVVAVVGSAHAEAIVTVNDE